MPQELATDLERIQSWSLLKNQLYKEANQMPI
jgi:hypothetical protein